MNKIEFIAAIRHIGWVTYQIAVDQDYNEEINDDQLESLINGVMFQLDYPYNTSEENHENWMIMKCNQGWEYGPVKDFDKKTHPDLIPYDDLPEVEKRKDAADITSHRMAVALWDEVNDTKEIPDTGGR